MYPFCFGGHDFLAMQDAALFWPARQALLVADLHLEKASWYALRGQMLPPYDSMATLERVHRLIDRTDAQELWALGDSFHDVAGVERLVPDVAEGLRALSQRVDLHWIAGNHDGLSGAALGGEVHEDVLLNGVVLRHHAAPAVSGQLTLACALDFLLRDRHWPPSASGRTRAPLFLF